MSQKYLLTCSCWIIQMINMFRSVLEDIQIGANLKKKNVFIYPMTHVINYFPGFQSSNVRLFLFPDPYSQ